jgi:hypothetical protein
MNAAASPPLRASLDRGIRASFWVIGTGLAAAQAWAGRQAMNADGVSYLEVAEAYLRRDWAGALNAYWSPLYSWALAAAKIVNKPFSADEFAVAHVMNIVVFLGAFACFDRFLVRLIRFHKLATGDRLRDAIPMPDWVLLVVGYTAFLWSSLTLIGLQLVSPDLVLAAFVYLACSILLDLRLGDTRWPTFASLGLVLGLGYLAKAPLFPLAPVFITVGSLIARPEHRLRSALVTTAAFLLIAGPFAFALSVQKGRPTFGDSGKLNYAWYVNGVQRRHWQGGTSTDGAPLHPTRKVFASPPVFEFNGPIGGTYPVWYDPSYWYDGVKIRLDPTKQLAQIYANSRVYRRTFLNIHARTLLRQGEAALVGSPLLLFGLFLGLVHRPQRAQSLSRIFDSWFLITPSIAALLMFSLVHVESRLIAAYAVALYLALLMAVRLKPVSRSFLPFSMILLSLVVCLLVVVDLSRDYLVDDPALNPRQDLEIELKRIGIRPGDKIASLDYSNRNVAPRAHRDELKIVAEIYEEDQKDDEDLFWQADDAAKARVVQAFSDAGAIAVIAHNVPTGTAGWLPIGSTGYSLYPLRKNAGAGRIQRLAQPEK